MKSRIALGLGLAVLVNCSTLRIDTDPCAREQLRFTSVESALAVSDNPTGIETGNTARELESARKNYEHCKIILRPIAYEGPTSEDYYQYIIAEREHIRACDDWRQTVRENGKNFLSRCNDKNLLAPECMAERPIITAEILAYRAFCSDLEPASSR